MEAKEYATALETKSEATQASLMAKIELAMEQNTKLLAMMAKGGFNSNTSNGTAKDQLRCGQRRGKKEPRVCKHCGEEGYHKDDQCFSLEKNKAKRPKWYNDKLGE